MVSSKKADILIVMNSLRSQITALNGLYGDIVRYPYFQEENRSTQAQEDIYRRLKEVYKEILKVVKLIKPKRRKRKQHAI